MQPLPSGAFIEIVGNIVTISMPVVERIRENNEILFVSSFFSSGACTV
jgi:hypothetical protein